MRNSTCSLTKRQRNGIKLYRSMRINNATIQQDPPTHELHFEEQWLMEEITFDNRFKFTRQSSESVPDSSSSGGGGGGVGLLDSMFPCSILRKRIQNVTSFRVRRPGNRAEGDHAKEIYDVAFRALDVKGLKTRRHWRFDVRSITHQRPLNTNTTLPPSGQSRVTTHLGRPYGISQHLQPNTKAAMLALYTATDRAVLKTLSNLWSAAFFFFRRLQPPHLVAYPGRKEKCKPQL
ncbi:hypothetical protein F2P81_020540 [Scophthalmus maximus]|uniref:Uncharacterized protein n=1 Tax=Scophthalmus maximus TaxID=52904 RepID=A0A6A4S5H0_SCOMX|nr:hypothetical protein F2P81_020540 [Scophthalmus maximus]